MAPLLPTGLPAQSMRDQPAPNTITAISAEAPGARVAPLQEQSPGHSPLRWPLIDVASTRRSAEGGPPECSVVTHPPGPVASNKRYTHYSYADSVG